MTEKEENDSLKKLLEHVTAQRDAALMKLGLSEEEIQVIGFKAVEDGGVSMELSHSSFEMFAISLVKSFKDSSAINYNSIGILDPQSGDIYQILMQKVGGKTPA